MDSSAFHARISILLVCHHSRTLSVFIFNTHIWQERCPEIHQHIQVVLWGNGEITGALQGFIKSLLCVWLTLSCTLSLSLIHMHTHVFLAKFLMGRYLNQFSAVLYANTELEMHRSVILYTHTHSLLLHLSGASAVKRKVINSWLL